MLLSSDHGQKYFSSNIVSQLLSRQVYFNISSRNLCLLLINCENLKKSMNPDQQAAVDRVPRFLDDLEPIDRRRLNQENKKKERWSLSGKQDDTQTLSEMGVAPLTGECSDEDKTSGMGKEDIENLSPNLNSGKCNKRSYRQAAFSPKGIPRNKFSEDNDSSNSKKAKTRQEHEDKSMILESSAQFVPETNENSLKGPHSSGKKSLHENTMSNIDSSHKTSPLLKSSSCKKGESWPKKNMKEDNTLKNDRLAKQNEPEVRDKQCDAKIANEGCSNWDKEQTAAKDIFNETIDVFGNAEDCETARKMYTSNTAGMRSEPHSSNCEEEICPLSTVDCAILDYPEEDLEQTLLNDKENDEEYFELASEKECDVKLPTTYTIETLSIVDFETPKTRLADVSSKICHCVSTGPRSDEDDSDSVFSKLSDEVILSILQWLPKRILIRCMHVSKRWRRLATDGILWARVDLGGKVLPSGALQILMNRHPLVLRMANTQLANPTFTSPVKNEWRVQFLDLTCATLSPGCLNKIIGNCPQLVKLSIEALALDKDAHKTLAKLTQLRTLNASQVAGFDVECCKSLANMTKLEHLNIAWTKLNAECLNVLFSSLKPRLSRLNLAGCRKTLLNEGVVSLVNALPNLMELDISDATEITSDSAKAITSLNFLEHLAISRCYRLQLEDYVMLKECRSLVYVDAFGILPPINLLLLHKHLPNMQFNKFMHSSIARPTVGNRRTSIWGLRTRD